MRLVESPNFAPQILRCRTNFTNTLSPQSTIKEMNLFPSLIFLEWSSKERKLELENIKTNKRKLEYVENTISIKEEYKAKLAWKQTVREREDNLKDYFLWCWEDIKPYGHYINMRL